MSKHLAGAVAATTAALLFVAGGTNAETHDHSLHSHEVALKATDGQAHDHASHTAAAGDPHAHHQQMMERNGYDRSTHHYTLPDLTLVDMDGKKTRLLSEVNADQPVMLNFIYTTCTTICPALSATFAQVQSGLGPESKQVRMISVTIDPEHDTPQRLRAYAKRFGAGPQWRFLTGDLSDIVATQKAFDAFRGRKANHVPLIFLRANAEAPWVRLDGLASAADVIKEYRTLTAR